MASRNRSAIALFPAVLYEHRQHDQDGFRVHEIHCQLKGDPVSSLGWYDLTELLFLLLIAWWLEAELSVQ